jgi:hypothetical protein
MSCGAERVTLQLCSLRCRAVLAVTFGEVELNAVD